MTSSHMMVTGMLQAVTYYAQSNLLCIYVYTKEMASLYYVLMITWSSSQPDGRVTQMASFLNNNVAYSPVVNI